MQANGNAGNDGQNAHNGRDRQAGISAINTEAENDRDHDKQDGDHRRGRVGCAGRHVDRTVRCVGRHKGISHNGSKGRDHQQQRQVREDDEQLLCLAAHGVGDHLADGLALMPNGRKQRAKVMHSAKENTADQHPQQHRHPAEYRRLDRSVDRACTGDGREVMSHQNRRLCRHIVHTIILFIGRRLARGVDAPLLGQPAAVSQIRDH